MLTREQKKEQVSELKDKFSRANSVFVTDYRGITVDEATKLRADLRGEDPSDSEYRVTKNSVLRHAVEGTELEAIGGYFSGPTSIAISYGDPVRVAKVLVNTAKEIDDFEIKGGYLDGQTLDEAGVAKLATLPSLLELRGTLAGLLLAPASKLARLLNEPGRQLARLVDARRKVLEEGGT